MEVEDVARVSLATRRPAQGQRQLAIRPRLLGEVVVAAERFFALLHEVLPHRASRVGSDEVERGRLGGGGGDDDRVAHRAVLFECGGDARNRCRVLADGDVDADEVLALLVDDRVEQDRGLAGKAVTDDQLALAAAKRDHRVDGLDPGLDRAVDALARDDARSDLLQRHRLFRLDRALAVDGYAQRVDDAADELLPDGHLQQPAGGVHLVALVQVAVFAEDDRADLVFLEVEREAVGVVWELEQLAGHCVLQPIDLGDAVAGRDYAAHVARHQCRVEVLETLLDDLRDLFRADTHSLLLLGCTGQDAPQLLQSCRDAGVDEVIAVLEPEATEDAAVDLGRDAHLLADLLREALADERPLFIRQLDGGRHRGTHPALGLVDEALVLIEDLGCAMHMTSLDEESHEGRALAIEKFRRVNQVEPLCDRNGRVLEHRRCGRIAGHVHDRLQATPPLLNLAVRGCELKNGPRIALSGRRCH